MMRKFSNRIAGVILCCAVAAGAFCATAPTPAAAQEDNNKPRTRQAQSLQPTTAKALNDVFELMNTKPPQLQQALAKIDQLIANYGSKMKPYDKATTYQMRGSIRVQMENYKGALSDFQTALAANGLPPEQNDQLRYYIAQLQFQLQNFRAAIQGLNEWISSAKATGQKVDANAYYLLAAAYVQLDPPNYRAAMSPAEQAIAGRTEPKKSDYDLLNLIYSETNSTTKRAALLEKMINLWPDQRSYWVQLSGLYSTSGKDQQAFAVLEVAYRAGLLQKEAELLTLVNYYSFFDNAYRGAQLLEREMNAGRIKKTEKNLTLLSQLWSQAREHKRAIPVLEQAAKLSSKGILYYRLGQVLLADEQYAKSASALVKALNKGGLDNDKRGDAWLLLGTARFSGARPEDCGARASARKAFVEATRYPKSARQAREWITYIDAITKTLKDQDVLEQQQNEEARQDQISRLKTAEQVCRLKGSEDCSKLAAQREALVKAGPVPLRSSCKGSAPAKEEDAGDKNN